MTLTLRRGLCLFESKGMPVPENQICVSSRLFFIHNQSGISKSENMRTLFIYCLTICLVGCISDVILAQNNNYYPQKSKTPIESIRAESTSNKSISYDYFALYANGMSTEEILRNTEAGSVGMSYTYKQADARYRGANGPFKDLTDDQFARLYAEAVKSFQLFKQKKNNGNIADAWEYEKPGGLTGEIDMQPFRSTQGEVGYTREGEPMVAAAEVADARNKPNFSSTLSFDFFSSKSLCKCRMYSYWVNNKEYCNREEMKQGKRLENYWKQNCSLPTYSLKSNTYASCIRDFILLWDVENLPYWQEVYIKD